MFGYMHKRTLHYIIGCRQRHPTKRIWISKIDWKSAYRRQHFNWLIAVKSLTQVCRKWVWLLLMALRLIFGCKSCPSEWGCISETVTDLATDILNCEDWDPTRLHAPKQSEFPPRSSLPDNIPFAQAKQTIVAIPLEDKGKCDVYIDDTIAVGPDINDNASRLEAAIPLAMHIFGRPLSPNEPIPRSALISHNKLLAEGRIEEVKMLLGWLYDTRRHLISLPDDKHINWSNDITTMRKENRHHTVI